MDVRIIFRKSIIILLLITIFSVGILSLGVLASRVFEIGLNINKIIWEYIRWAEETATWFGNNVSTTYCLDSNGDAIRLNFENYFADKGIIIDPENTKQIETLLNHYNYKKIKDC